VAQDFSPASSDTGHRTPDTGPPAPGAARLDYDSPLFDAFARLLEPFGRMAFAALPLPVRAIDGEAELARVLALENGVWRVRASQPAQFVYCGFVLQYDALADERASGLAAVWVNSETRSIPRWGRSLLDDPRLEAADAPDGLRELVASCWRCARGAAMAAITRDLSPFVESVERRRVRDLTRMREYYEAIDGELRRKIARNRKDESRRNADTSRLEATGRAFEARAADLSQRYRMRVAVTPVGVLACLVPGCLVQARLMRRGCSTELAFAWNPLDKGIEKRCCDGCLAVVDTAWLCDDRVHYLCRGCLSPCPACGHRFCRACHARCPRKHA
jgi:ribosomal protein S21